MRAEVSTVTTNGNAGGEETLMEGMGHKANVPKVNLYGPDGTWAEHSETKRPRESSAYTDTSSGHALASAAEDRD